MDEVHAAAQPRDEGETSLVMRGFSLGYGPVLRDRAFMGVGAFTSAILFTRVGWPFWLSLPAAGLVAAGVGMIFGIPSLRLRGLYLAIATMAAQFIIDYALRNWTSLTGGSVAVISNTGTFENISKKRRSCWK
ncbi:MAG: branched-chain amino acid ABC transporter permease, partial [Nitrospirota bacterium]